MNNVTLTKEANTLIIKIDLSVPGTRSMSGKSTVIASTHGFQPVPGTTEKINLNIIR